MLGAAWLLCDINPMKTYSWYAGIWHGLFFVPNFILSLFTDTLYKANSSTTMYNVFWWIFAIINVLGTLLGSKRPSSQSYN